MANTELLAINSITKNKEVGVLFGESIDELMVNYGDVWDWIKKYYTKYRSVPDLDLVKETFPDVDEVDVNGATSYYVDSLRNEFLHNRMEQIIIKSAQALQDNSAPVEVMDKLQRSVAKLNRFTGTAKDIDIMDFEQAEQSYENLREKAAAMGGVPGIPTGLAFIDSVCPRGLQGGDIFTIIGYPARGKSAMVSLLAANAYSLGYKPMIASLEMSADAVRDRIYTVLGSGLFSNSDLMIGNVDADKFRTFASQNKRDSGIIVVENDSGNVMTPNVLQAKIDQHKPDIVFMDYQQLFYDNAKTQDMTGRMRNLSLEIKHLSMVTDLPFVVISSATPDNASNITQPPNVEQTAWSRQLAYDSSLCAAIHRHDGTNIFEIVGAKNRYGDLFAALLDWDIDRGIITEKFEA